MEKIIIWGHKHTDTFSYIHQAYYKAFKYLGYEVYWFDDKDDVSNFNFSNCLFFTEGQVQDRIPLDKSSKYILHHVDPAKYIDNNLHYINLGNYTKHCDEGVSLNYEGGTVEKVSDYCFWDTQNKTIYQPWATDLTPNEINTNDAISFNEEEPDCYIVGTVHENLKNIKLFSEGLNDLGKTLKVVRTSPVDDVARDLIRKSFISADIRGDWHLECGYIPCRVFKNISYGRITGTNSENVKNIFKEHVVYNPNPKELSKDLVRYERESSIEDIKASMNFIKENHTFINRINNLINLL